MNKYIFVFSQYTPKMYGVKRITEREREGEREGEREKNRERRNRQTGKQTDRQRNTNSPKYKHNIKHLNLI